MRVLVVGAGVVGLAVARAAVMRGHEVVVAEAARRIGTGISSRNSEVIHAGLYYPTGSLRAVHCVRGRRLLYDYCEERGVAHRRCGKLVVATEPGEVPKIEAIGELGRANGVPGLTMLDAAEARDLEPALRCVAALRSDATGIIDGHALMSALRGDFEDHGGAIAFATQVDRLRRTKGGWVVEVSGADALDVDAVVGAGGLGAQALARRTEDYPSARVPRLVLARGNYFTYAGAPVFSRLVYPAPRIDGGLGIHVTLDLAGAMRFGPDVEWIEHESYDVDPARAESFYASVRRYWPGLPDGSLQPGYAGIRPKITGPGETAADFVVDGPEQHGLSGLVHLFGIESPGLTAALSLADDVVARLS
jgi:L-2-hydroxyglutarate oxidase LhgO